MIGTGGRAWESCDWHRGARVRVHAMHHARIVIQSGAQRQARRDRELRRLKDKEARKLKPEAVEADRYTVYLYSSFLTQILYPLD